MDVDKVAFLHSPDGLRGSARFLRKLYPPQHPDALDNP